MNKRVWLFSLLIGLCAFCLQVPDTRAEDKAPQESMGLSDLLQDSWKINEMISEDSYDIGFNMDGSARVYHKGGDMEEDRYVENSCENVKNIFECSMEDVLRSAVPRKTIKICHNINA